MYLNPMSTYGSEYLNSMKISDIDSIRHIPVFSLGGYMCRKEISSGQYFTYFMAPDFTRSPRLISNTTNNVIDRLTRSMAVVKTQIGNDWLYIVKGLIYNEKGEIMLCLTIDRDEYHYNNEAILFDSEEHNFLGYQSYTLFLATEFITNPNYATFLRRFNKAYVDFCYSKGVEVRIMPSKRIEANTFANEFKIDFNSIDEMNRCLREEVGKILVERDSYFLDSPLFHKPSVVYPAPADYFETFDRFADAVQGFSERDFGNDSDINLRYIDPRDSIRVPDEAGTNPFPVDAIRDRIAVLNQEQFGVPDGVYVTGIDPATGNSIHTTGYIQTEGTEYPESTIITSEIDSDRMINRYIQYPITPDGAFQVEVGIEPEDSNGDLEAHNNANQAFNSVADIPSPEDDATLAAFDSERIGESLGAAESTVSTSTEERVQADENGIIRTDDDIIVEI